MHNFITFHHIPSSKFWFMDETCFWTGAVTQRTYVDPATNDPSVLQVGNNSRDTGVVALAADGSIDATFIEHVPQKTKKMNGHFMITEKGISGMGTDKMIEWAHGFGRRHGDPNHMTILVLDALASHKSSVVESTLQSYNIKLFILPPRLAIVLSPCDNCFFAAMKAQMGRLDTSTRDKKKSVFVDVCARFPAETIRKYFKHCGWNI